MLVVVMLVSCRSMFIHILNKIPYFSPEFKMLLFVTSFPTIMGSDKWRKGTGIQKKNIVAMVTTVVMVTIVVTVTTVVMVTMVEFS